MRPSGRVGGPEITAPVSGVEVALVARAVPAVRVGLVVDDAAEVRALLAERDHLPVGDAQQDRRVARRSGSGTGTSRRRRRSSSATIARGVPVLIERSCVHAASPTLPAAIAPAPEHEVAGELASRHLLLAGGLVREVAPPDRDPSLVAHSARLLQAERIVEPRRARRAEHVERPAVEVVDDGVHLRAHLLAAEQEVAQQRAAAGARRTARPCRTTAPRSGTPTRTSA